MQIQFLYVTRRLFGNDHVVVKFNKVRKYWFFLKCIRCLLMGYAHYIVSRLLAYAKGFAYNWQKVTTFLKLDNRDSWQGVYLHINKVFRNSMSIFMNSFFPSTSKMIPSLTNDASALMIGKCFPDLNTVFCMKVIDIPTLEIPMITPWLKKTSFCGLRWNP